MTEDASNGKTPVQDKRPFSGEDKAILGFCVLPCSLIALLVFVGLVWKFTKWAFW